jgi:hypothetical protein
MMKNNQSLKFILLLTVMALLIAGCQPQAQRLAGPDPTAVAASVEAAFAQSPVPAATDTPVVIVPTDEPKIVEPVDVVAEPLLPAPLYFLSEQSGSWQIWRIEMNGGFAHPITDLPAPVYDFDISPVDGRLAYVSGNDLYISEPDGSNPQMLVNGEDVDPNLGFNGEKTLGRPLWSPDGRELAYSLNGVNVFTLETGVIRMLITNQVSEDDKFINWRSYFPVYWSPDGNYIATQIGFYEGTGLTVLPANGGAPLVEELFYCCDITPAEDPGYFYIASAAYGYGDPGMWKVEWATGTVTRLTEEQLDFSNLIAYSHPMLLDGEAVLHDGKRTLHGPGPHHAHRPAERRNPGRYTLLRHGRIVVARCQPAGCQRSPARPADANLVDLWRAAYIGSEWQQPEVGRPE